MPNIKKTGFSPEWDDCYRDNNNFPIWPWSDVVSLVYRYCKNIITLKSASVLELGCGAGANIPFFKSLGMNYYAIEGSSFIVKQLQQSFPDIAAHIQNGDFTIDQPFKRDFDLVIDRAAITHNNTVSIQNTIENISNFLKPDGLFIGVDWFSTNHTDYLDGEIVDEYTRTNFKKGQFASIGNVHFSNEAHLKELFKNFEIIFMQEKIRKFYKPQRISQVACWDIVVKKVATDLYV